MVSLTKGQGISLTKAAPGLTRVAMGLGWDVAKSGGIFGRFMKPENIDLDASCVLFDAQGQEVDAVWFRQLRSKDGSILHTGDNLTGEGDGDDEVIKVDLSAVPASVKTIVFTVSSFRGQTFQKVENATCRIVNEADGRELARYNLSGSGPHTAQIMAKLVRGADGWEFIAIGDLANGATIGDMMPAIRRHV